MPTVPSDRVLLVGGGIGSLLLGLLLRERHPTVEVTLLTADDEASLGGHLSTHDEAGYTVEHGYHSLFGFYDAVLPELERLGLLSSFHPISDPIQVYENGGLHPLGRASLTSFRGFSAGQLAGLATAMPALGLLMRQAAEDFDSLDRYDDLDLRALGREIGAGKDFLESNFVQMFYDFGFNAPSEMSAAVGLKTLAKLRESPTLYQFGLPADQALIRPLRARFEALGGRMLLEKRLLRVVLAPGGARAEAVIVADKSGQEQRMVVDELVLALDLEGFKAVGWTGADPPSFAKAAAGLTGVSSISLQAWFPHDPVPPEVHNVVGGLPEPLSVLCPVSRVRGGAGPQGYELIALGPEVGFENSTDGELADRLFSTLRRIGWAIPSNPKAWHLHMHRNREPRERYLLTLPGQLGIRPTPETSVENLRLVGAWLRNSFSLPSVQGTCQAAHTAAAALGRRFQQRAAARGRVAEIGASLRPMPRFASAYPLPPYRKLATVNAWLVDAVDAEVHALLPDLLEPLPGIGGQLVLLANDYQEAGSPDDPFRANYPFQEIILAVPVRERAGLRPGLWTLAAYVDSDTAMNCGRELYGYPKVFGHIAVDDARFSLVRNGLPPGRTGNVAPITLLEGSWEVGAGEGLLGQLTGALVGLGIRELAQRVVLADGLMVYNEQIQPSAPGLPTLGLRRLLASPLVEIAVEEVTPLLDVELRVGRSVLDPLHRLLVHDQGRLRVSPGLRARTRFTVDRAAVVGGSPDSVR